MTFASNSTCILYFDAVSIGNIGCITLPTGMNSINIGEQNIPGASGNLNGKIDDVRFYNRVLSATEVTTLYSSYSVGQTRINAPNNNGLVGYWNFEENAGTKAMDSSGRGNTGTLTNGPVWTGGKFGKGLAFDGTDDYVDAGTTAPTITSGGITLSQWIKSSAIGQNKSIISKRYITGGDWIDYMIFTSNDSSYVMGFVYTVGNGTYHQWSTTSTASALGLADGNWHLVTVSYTYGTGSSMKLYVDGTSAAGSWISGDGNSLPSGRNAGETLTIGSTTGGASAMTGSLDDVRIYNRALSATEVANLYNVGR